MLVKYQSELEPEYQATSMNFTEVYSNSMRVNYAGSVDLPTGYLVVMRVGSYSTADPIDGSVYTLNQTLGDGTVVYVGSATSFTMPSLIANTGYYYKVYAYNGSGQGTNYKVSTPLSGSQTTYASGLPWTSINNDSYWYPSDVHFFDANSGGVAGGYAFKTTNDGGQNLLIGGATGDLYDGIFFTSSTTGYTVGGNGATTRVIRRTVNGGSTWVDQLRVTGNALYDVWFTNSITGFAVGAGGNILRTTNGISWSSITSPTINDLTGINFPISTTGYAVGKAGTIIKTTNGTTWYNPDMYATMTTNDLNDVFFTDANTGYVVGDLGTIYKTTNGGLNWSAQISNTTQDLNGVHFVDANTGYAVGQSGTILKTINGGNDWYAFTAGADAVAHYRGVHFPTPNTGYAVGYSGTDAIIYKFQSAPKPTAQPTALAFSSISATGLTVSFAGASGSPVGYIAIRRIGSAPTSAPLDGIAYVAGATLGDGVVAYVGSSTSFVETTLTSGTDYSYKVYSYNSSGEGASTNYLQTSPLMVIQLLRYFPLLLIMLRPF